MHTRRSAIKTIALTTGAVALSTDGLRAQAPATPAEVFKLPALGYDYDALEPHIDAETMKIHHDKHHAAYVAKLNATVATVPGLEKKSIEEILTTLDSAPEAARKDLRNQGGGHYNHSLFWQTLKKADNSAPAGELAKAIDTAFGSLAKWQDAFGDAAMKTFGSGWAWLVLARWQARSGVLAKPGFPALDRRHTAPRHRCVGARLLFEISKSPGGLREGIPERD